MSTSFRQLLPEGGDSTGGSVDLGNTFKEGYGDSCKLSKKQRLRGFLVCFAVGWILMACSLITIPGLALGKPAPFAVLYTIGNIVALSATFFLWGPMAQLKSMFKPIRAGASVIYLVTLVLTLVLALATHNGVLVLICLALQFCAMVWYAASYVPYGRAMIKKMLGGAFSSIANEPA